MTPTDKKRLLELLPQVCAFYKRDFSPFLGSVWMAAMEPYSFEEVSGAITRHTMNPDSGQFMPLPADVVKMLGGTSTDTALSAWSKVERAVRSVGQYVSVVFDDPLIHRVVDDMGGWVKLCACPKEEDFVFVGKEFQNRYRGFAMRSERPDYQPVLIGLAQAQNAQQGVRYSEPPRAIGNPEKCRLVYEGGNQTASLTVSSLPLSGELLRLGGDGPQA